MEERYSRQEFEIDRDNLNRSICIVGAGSVGSLFTLLACKMGYAGQIGVYDDDKVELHNLANQFYSNEDASTSRCKVHALRETIMSMTDRDIYTEITRLSESPPDYDILILAVDNMNTRRELYKKFRGQYLVDARVGGENLRVYTVDMNNNAICRKYNDTLYKDASASEATCHNQSLIYTVSVTAGLMLCQLKKALSGQHYPWEIILNLRTLTLLQDLSS